MSAILKWSLDVTDHPQSIGSGRVALIGQQHDGIKVWTIEPDYANSSRVVRIVATGQAIPDGYEHLGSVQVGPYVWHIFEEARR